MFATSERKGRESWGKICSVKPGTVCQGGEVANPNPIQRTRDSAKGGRTLQT